MISTPPAFQLVLVKPSHYDDDGYVIQWLRSSVPSNTLAAIFGLGLDCADRRVLGDDVAIEITALDETNTRIRVDRLVRQVEAAGGHGLVALVGVQTNQFPRAVDLGLRFVEKNIPVCIGGFHVSGCLSMLPEKPADLVAAMDAGISLFAGELEGRMDGLLRDAMRNELRPLYEAGDLPALEGLPVPYLPAKVLGRMSGSRASFDAGRGCPFLCSFCTIINVQGRTSRHRSPDDIEAIVRANLEQGIHKFFITDDNFARNEAWEPLFDRLISLREQEGLQFKITIQVDTLCHTIPRFIDKAAAAGVDRVFIGLESINAETLVATGKGQNKITEYRKLLQAWHAAGALTLAGYLIGFPADTPETIRRDIRIIQRELAIDLLYFFILTPLPGSQDHKELVEKGVPLGQDMNDYDSVHVAMPHGRMTSEELLGAYRDAWDTYYTGEHVERVMLRGRRRKFDVNKIRWMMFSFHAAATVEGVHPMDSGICRLKYRRDRRPGRPLESPWVFYPRYALEQVRKLMRYGALFLRNRVLYRRVMTGRSRLTGPDAATTPVSLAEYKTLDLFQTTPRARALAARSQARVEKAEARALALAEA